MKIAFIIGQFPSLSETFILNQITGLIKAGHEIKIYAMKAPKIGGKIHKDVELYNLLSLTDYYPATPRHYVHRGFLFLFLFIKYFFVNPHLLLRTLNINRYGKYVLNFRLFFTSIPFLKSVPKYDIIHCHHGHIGLIGSLLREIGAIEGKLIVTFHGYDVNVIPKIHGSHYYKLALNLVDLITVNSNFTKSKVVDLGFPKEKIFKLPVGVDIQDFAFQARCLEGNTVKLITVGRLVEKKGIEYSIRAVARVIQRYPDIIYRIVGDGLLYDHLDTVIKELNLSDKIRLMGSMSKEEVLKLYQDSHLFILSSVTASNGDQEGQGLVLQEAQAIGLPIIATIHNGFLESIDVNRSGYLVPERDIHSLAERIEFLIRNPHSWPSMGSSGRKFVEEKFSLESLNAELINIYQNANLKKCNI
jgi:colanic acid/amylovoran biosynthesis glycosyltransferase